MNFFATCSKKLAIKPVKFPQELVDKYARAREKTIKYLGLKSRFYMQIIAWKLTTIYEK